MQLNNKPLSYYLEDPQRIGEVEAGAIDELLQQYPYNEHLHFLKLADHFASHGEWNDQLLASAATYSSDRTVLRQRMDGLTVIDSIVEQAPAIEPPLEQAALTRTSHLAMKDGDLAVQKTIILDDDDLEAAPKPKKRKQKKKKKKRQKLNRLDKALLESEEQVQTQKADEFIVWLQKLEAITSAREQRAVAKSRTSKKKKQTKKSKAKRSLPLDETPISETLAELLAQQGRTPQAVAMFEKLRLKYPEKSSFFAARIQDLAQKK